ncbi:Oxoglutarate/iron-dependent dioxygenase [Cinnamomum micranthum f. kanehirae]|uniref:Oxoglutarate/iron-dependent dioxygenase n=1 Tax=Cinnamomum micranthum f. kanehirae TaxID=337451 RepID=A0A443PJI0_9MAGN|nr:Oxoglutarate/iron-dependent dioxygenase [Cinnamomum micranthum f. kanehirae]
MLRAIGVLIFVQVDQLVLRSVVNHLDYLGVRITNHGVKQCLMKELIRVLEDFYSLPWEQKVKYVSDYVTSPVRYGTSLNTPLVHENTRYWRDHLRHFGHPLESNIQHWPADPLSYSWHGNHDAGIRYDWKLWMLPSWHGNHDAGIR